MTATATPSMPTGLKRLRERIRVLSGDTEGGASLEDLARGIARRFPDLPPLPRTTAPVDPLRLSFDELWAKLQHGHCAVLDGNPVRVTDPLEPAALDAGQGRLRPRRLRPHRQG